MTQAIRIIRGQQFNIENQTFEVERVHNGQVTLRNTNPLRRNQRRTIPKKFLEQIP